MSKTCLVIIYNHQFLKNIDKIEKLYGQRFDKIFHLMPFYKGTRENIIPIYENSFCFSGYVPQALEKIFSEEYSYYAFMGDDVVLHPNLNSGTIEEYLKINENTGFTARNTFCFNSDYLISRIWLMPSVMNWLRAENRKELEKMLPDIATMVAKYKNLNIKCTLTSEEKIRFIEDVCPMTRTGHFFYKYRFDTTLTDYKKIFDTFKEKDGVAANYVYPFAAGFSDFFVVPKDTLKTFAKYCGIFATARIFAEVAVPTALVASLDNLSRPLGIGRNVVNYASSDPKRAEFPDLYNKSVKNLYERWDDKNILMHPVKFSIWEMDLD